MNRGGAKLTLALLVGLATTVALVSWLSTARARAAAPVEGEPGVPCRRESPVDGGAVSAAQHAAGRSLASASVVNGASGSTSPLTIPLAISDTLGPRLLRPEGYPRYDFHRGLDWPAPTGTPVLAVTTATVRLVRADWPDGLYGSGKFVHLTHEHLTCETRYNHLSEVFVEQGDEVTPGRVIGRVGRSGAHYPHLHFEVRQGMTVTQRAAIHPLSTPFLPWTNKVTPTVALRSTYTDATGLTALVEVTSPYTEPDVKAVGVTVSGTVTDSRILDYVGLNANTTVVADLDDPLVNGVCVIPEDLNTANDYRVTMAFRELGYGPNATVNAQVADVGGRRAISMARLVGGLVMTPLEQSIEGVPGETVTLVYTLTNRTGATAAFTFTHLSAQGWPSLVMPAAYTLGHDDSVRVTVVVTLNTKSFGPPDCGLLLAESQSGAQPSVAGFYRIYRDAYVSAAMGEDQPACGSQVDPCASIGYGIGRTDAGGTVRVAQGIYTENLTLTKTIDLLGSYAPDWADRALARYATTVDADHEGAVLVVDGDYGPLIEGFTFFKGNLRGHAGGGVRLVGGAAPTLRSNWIVSNTAERSGGGIYVGPYGTLPPTIIDNIIVGNRSSGSYGGGIYVKDRPALIQGNVISGNRAFTDGGGIYLTGGTTARVLGNYIQQNAATRHGGGVAVRSSGATFVDNIVADNRADIAGSGVYIRSCSPRLWHTTIARNRGGDGSGVCITGTSSSAGLINTILVSHAVGIFVEAGNTATLTATLWGTGTWTNGVDWDGEGEIFTGTVNVWGDPAFVDPGRGDYHILPGSKAINTGVFAGITTDIDGHSRPAGGDYGGSAAVDIGADEYCVFVHLPLVVKGFPPCGFTYDVEGCLPPADSSDEVVQ